MQSDKAKVLHTIGGIPLVAHPIHLVDEIAPERIIVVVGHQGEIVEKTLRQRFGDDKLFFTTQHEQLGTGHAVMSAEKELREGAEEVLILYGDVPLLTIETINAMLEAKQAQKATITILSFMTDDPTGYGRIVRDSQGIVQEIREHRDCHPTQLSIKECNSGIYLVDRDFLVNSLSRIGTNNKQKEYYLTDIVQLAVQDSLKVIATPVNDPLELFGVNDRSQLALLEEHWLTQR